MQVGRSIYWNVGIPNPREEVKALGKGLYLGRGGFTSAIACWKPYLNVDGKYYHVNVETFVTFMTSRLYYIGLAMIHVMNYIIEYFLYIMLYFFI